MKRTSANAVYAGRALVGLSLLVSLLVLIPARRPGIAGQEPNGDDDRMALNRTMEAFLADHLPPQDLAPLSSTPCIAGSAGVYPCKNVELLAFMPLANIGGGNGNDIWGWTDPLDGKEYAVMGRSSGTSFVDISDPRSPIYLGDLPRHDSDSLWRDIKVYANHAFVVSESLAHGMQVFDLTQLRNVPSPPVTFSETAHYSGFGRAHNIVINEDSGYAYAVGSNTCLGGLHMINIQNPTSPMSAGCFTADGFTHDAQCVIYHGPDTDHQGKEICFNSNEDTITVVDVTNKAAPVQLSRTGYFESGYTHQGWLTSDHAYFLLNDELDELRFGHNTRTRIWDMSDLDNPLLIGIHDGRTPSIDHNLYIHNGYAYEANYRSGLSVLYNSDVSNGELTEVAYFDIYPASDSPNYNGAWSVYPFFDSGVVIVSGIEQGLFILEADLSAAIQVTPPSLTSTLHADSAVTHTLMVSNTGSANLAWSIDEDADGTCSSPSDIPWISVSPDAHTTSPGSGTDVQVTFDTAGLIHGIHTGTLCVNNNAPAAPLVSIPITMTVTNVVYLPSIFAESSTPLSSLEQTVIPTASAAVLPASASLPLAPYRRLRKNRL